MKWVLPAFAEPYRVPRDDSFAVTFYGWPHADVFVAAFKEAGIRPVGHLAFLESSWELARALQAWAGRGRVPSRERGGWRPPPL